MGEGRCKNDVFTVAGKTLIKKKVAEKLTGVREEISGKALDWGTDNEPHAIALYEECMTVEIEPAPFCPLEGYEDYAGGSPDGFIDGGTEGIIEVKAPFNSANHIDAFIEGNIPKKSYNLYYTQIQFNMMCTGAKYCDFVSYDPRMIKEEHKIFAHRIHRDEDYIAKIKSRLDLAVLEMKNIISNI